MSASKVREKSDSESEICHSFPIPELIKLVKSSCRESEFSEVERKLIDYENRVKTKIESLVKVRDSLREKIRLLEVAHTTCMLDKMEFEVKWQETRKECEVLKERIDWLSENGRLASGTEKKGGGWCMMKAWEEKSDVERSREVSRLKTENKELKLKSFQSWQMCKEMEGLRKEKEVADRAVEELKHRELNLNRTVEELRLQNSESNKAAELSKRRFENLMPRISKVETSFASLLNVNVEDLVNIVKVREPSAGVEANHVHIPESLVNGSALNGEYTGNGNATGTSPEVHSARNSIGYGIRGLLKTGVENPIESSRTKRDGADGFHTSHVAQCACHPSEAETNDTDQERESKGVMGPGAHDSDLGLNVKVPITELVMSEAGCSGKVQCSSPAPLVVIEVSDSDDECISGEGACNSDNQLDRVVKEMIHAKPVPAPSVQTKKRNTTDWTESSPRSSNPKRKRIENRSESDKLQNQEEKEKKVLEPTRDRLCSIDIDCPLKPVLKFSSLPQHTPLSMRESNYGTPIQNFDDLSDGDSSGSDESCSESRINDLIAEIQSQKLGGKRICNAVTADSILIIDSDDEIKPVGLSCTSDSCANLGKNEKLCDKICSLGNIKMQQQQEKQIRKLAHGSNESLKDNFSGKLNPEFGFTAEVTLPSTNIQVIRRCEDKRTLKRI